MSATDHYACDKPGCTFILGAVGPMGTEAYDEFAEEVREHKRGHEPISSSSTAGLASLRYAPTNSPDGAVTSTPAPSGAPSLVELDRQEAMARVLNAAMDWADSWGDATAPVSTPERALVDAVRDYRAVAR